MKFRQVHLDFHTSEKIEGIGEKFNKEQFQNALKLGHVDSITVFSKCHHGWAYHPSKVNKMHPHLKFDLLAAQIEAAHEIGVKTPVYLSAGIDEKAVREHPEWRFEDRTHDFNHYATPDYHIMCFNTPYLDYLLAQIKEVCENYDADAIFLDILGVRPCCCSSCIKTMMERGMDPNDMDNIWVLGEEVYANYLKRVRETIDSVKPGLPVFHNGGHIRQGRRDLAYANSHLELESLPTGGWGYDHFPLSARYAQNLGMEYLGMTGKFHKSWGEFGGFKHPNALRFETALSVAHGAKCSIGDQLSPDGEMDFTTYKLIGEAYSELEEKEPWLDNVTPICDIAVLSLESVLNDNGEPGQNTMSDIGVGRILREGKYQYSVIDKEVDFNQYKVIILPDKIVPKQDIIDKLKAFILNGGKILASGESGIINNEFVFDFGAKYVTDGEYCPSYIRPKAENEYKSDFIMYKPYKTIENVGGNELATVVEPYFNRTKDHFCSHAHTPSSKKVASPGVIEGKDGIYIAWEIFSDYAENGELIAKNTVFNALDILLGDNKVLKTNLGSYGYATLMEQKEENRTIAHLLYAAAVSRGTYLKKSIEIIEDIYPVTGIELSVKFNRPVNRVYLAPQMTELDYEIENGYVTVKNLTVDCHQMVVFE